MGTSGHREGYWARGAVYVGAGVGILAHTAQYLPLALPLATTGWDAGTVHTVVLVLVQCSTVQYTV